MTLPDRESLDPGDLDDCFQAWRAELVRFSWSLVRDWNAAEDAVQTAFIQFAKHGANVEPDARKAWLYKVVYRESILVRKRSNGELEKIGRYAFRPVRSIQDDPSQRLLKNEEKRILENAIHQLSESQREVLLLRIAEDLGFAEIADRLKIPLGTALSRMRLALDRLRNLLDNDHSK